MFSANMKLSLDALSSLQPSSTHHLKVMNSWDGFPVTNEGGRMYTGNITDDKFRAKDVITWENFGVR